MFVVKATVLLDLLARSHPELALLIGLSGIHHYRTSLPVLAHECSRRVEEVLADPSVVT